MKASSIILMLFIWFPTISLSAGISKIYQQKDSGIVNAPSGKEKAEHRGTPPRDPKKPDTIVASNPAKPNSDKGSYVLDVIIQKSSGNKKEAAIGDLIKIKISNPVEFVDCRPGDRSKLELYADGRELKGFNSSFLNMVSKGAFKTKDSVLWVSFDFNRDSATKETWDVLYRLAGHWYKNQAKVHLSVGWQGMLPLATSGNDFTNTEVTLVLFSNAVFVWMIIGYLALLIGLGTLVLTTDILKDGPNGAYSLAQTQLAYWTILILAGFIYSLLITGIPSTMNTSVLTLLGISMSTTGIAKYIDFFRKNTDNESSKDGVEAVVAKRKKIHRNFWRDILGDGEDINMQRFQIFAWNIILGAYFTFFTFHNKTMPVIPDVLLTLAGISSLTYVAAKPTEVKVNG